MRYGAECPMILQKLSYNKQEYVLILTTFRRYTLVYSKILLKERRVKLSLRMTNI